MKVCMKNSLYQFVQGQTNFGSRGAKMNLAQVAQH